MSPFEIKKLIQSAASSIIDGNAHDLITHESAKLESIIGMVSTLVCHDNKVEDLDFTLRAFFPEYYTDINTIDLEQVFYKAVQLITSHLTYPAKDEHMAKLRLIMDIFHNKLADSGADELLEILKEKLPDYYADAEMHEEKRAMGKNPYGEGEVPPTETKSSSLFSRLSE